MAGLSMRKLSKRVRFAPLASQVTCPPNAEPPALEALWYGKGETQRLAKRDVDALTAQAKCRNVLGKMTPETSGICGNEVIEDGAVCSRGLEMYLPGQNMPPQSRQRSHVDALMLKQATLWVLYGRDNVKARDEVASRLQKFMTTRSKLCQEEALAWGVQDAMDAQLVHFGSTRPPTHLTASSSSPHSSPRPTKQTFTSVRLRAI
jgi:hypothetical protein